MNRQQATAVVETRHLNDVTGWAPLAAGFPPARPLPSDSGAPLLPDASSTAIAEQARLQERTRIARDLHDTLLQSAHSLVLAVHAMAAKFPPGNSFRAQVEQALDRAEMLLAEARDRILDIRSGNVDLQHALAAVAGDLSGAASIDVQIRTGGETRLLDLRVCHEVYLVCREALLNALAHSSAHRIDVAICFEVDHLRIRIEDDGCGIDSRMLAGSGRAGHWGLLGMQERAQSIGAQLRICSTKGGGTTVELMVPGSRAYGRDCLS